MDDVRVHRADCWGFDTRINCIGCFKAYARDVVSATHDHMLMDPSGRGTNSRAFKMAKAFLEITKDEDSSQEEI